VRYLGWSGDTLFLRATSQLHVLPWGEVRRIECEHSSRRAGAFKGAAVGTVVAVLVGLNTSDGLKSSAALLPSFALMGAGIGALRSGVEWRPIPRDALFAAAWRTELSVVAAEASTGATIERNASGTLPKGFAKQQAFAAAEAGAVGASIGAVAGLVLYFAALQQPGDGLEALGPPVLGGLLGYIVGAPIGVRRYSRERGVEGSMLGSYVGSTVGILGLAGAGVGFFVTVPIGATVGYNAR